MLVDFQVHLFLFLKMLAFVLVCILTPVLIEGAKKASARGVKPPVYTSGNVEGGTAKNIALEERYFGRVKRL